MKIRITVPATPMKAEKQKRMEKGGRWRRRGEVCGNVLGAGMTKKYERNGSRVLELEKFFDFDFLGK